MYANFYINSVGIVMSKIETMGETSPADIGETFDFSNTLFRNKFGFGIDFGSSIIKVSYTTEEGNYIRVHTVNFSRQFRQEAFQFLKKVCDGKLKPGGSYHTAGIGVGEYLDEIESMLNIKCKITSEFQHMLTAFTFLSKHQSWENFVHPPFPEARKKGASQAEALSKTQPTTFPESFWDHLPYLEEENASLSKEHVVHYPVILALVGSGHYLMKIDPDNKSKFLDHYTIAGKTLLGLGSLMVGADSFSDILDLATNGNSTELDMSVSQAGASASDDVYSLHNKCDLKIFSFGLVGPGKRLDDVKKEDVAAALRSMITNSVAQDAFNWSMFENVHQVFFVGGVVSNNQSIRREIEQEFMLKSYGNVKRHASDCLFVKAGGHLSAIGSLLSNLEIL